MRRSESFGPLLICLALFLAVQGCGNGEDKCKDKTNQCETLDDARCSSDGSSVETCAKDSDGCKVWTPSACGDHQSCDDSSLDCVCDDECDTEGDSHCDGTVIETCSLDGDDCLYWAVDEDCADNDQICDDTAGAAFCRDDCTDECTTEDATQCVGDVLETCEVGASGCLEWATTEDCAATGQICDSDVSPAACVCANECDTADDTQCDGDWIQVCTETAAGCLLWEDDQDCVPLGLICDDSVAPAVCVCDDHCSFVGETQCNGTVIEDCYANTEGCLRWQGGVDCFDTGEYCFDWAEPAECICHHECWLGETQCNGTVIETCEEGLDGCADWVGGIDCADTSQVCSDMEEPAGCVDPVTCDGDDLGSALGEVATGTNSGETDDYEGSCALTSGGLDLCYTWTAPDAATYQIDLMNSDYDTNLVIYKGGVEVACNEDFGGTLKSQVAVALEANDQIVIVVDAYGSSTGTYVLTIGAIDNENICDNWTDDDGDVMIDCGDPTDCQGVAAICEPGDGAVGDPCDLNSDCAANHGDPACFTDSMGWEGGYCSEWCDMLNMDCPAGSVCLRFVGGVSLCMDMCDGWQDSCRPGFRCCFDYSYGLNLCKPLFHGCAVDCPPNDPADLVEADDAGNSAVYWYYFWGWYTIVAGPGTAEETSLVLEDGMTYTIEGTSVDNGEYSADNDYMDVDSFMFNAGTATNVNFTLDVAGSGANVDVLVTDLNLNEVVGSSYIDAGSADAFDGLWEEAFSFAPTAGTDYLVSVGVFNGATGLPVDWQLNLCATGCYDICVEGTTGCDGPYIMNCVMGIDGCTVWEDSGVNCADQGYTCYEDAEPAYCACYNKCETEGDQRCYGPQIQTCGFDNEGCLDWFVTTNCLETSATCDDSSGTLECVEITCTDLGSAMGDAVASGTLAEGGPDTFLGNCAWSYGGADTCFTWTAPATGFYTMDTCESQTHYDTVLFVWNEAGEEISCNEDSCGYLSEVSITATAGEVYYIIVDSYDGYSYGDFTLDINEGCEPNTPADQFEAADATNNAVHWSPTTGGAVPVAGTGTAEDTGLTMAPDMVYTIEGTGVDNGEVIAGVNDYLDMDTFLFNSGTANDINIVLDVGGTTSDLDVLITDTDLNGVAWGTIIADGSSGTFDLVYEENFWISAEDAYQQNTDYLITIGTYESSTNLPADWQLTLCAE